MVTFNELRIDNDKDALIIDCVVEDLSIYANVYIDEIEIYHYSNTDSSGEPVDLSKVITVYQNSAEDTSVKAVRKCVSASSLGGSVLGVPSTFIEGIFFVRVTCSGTVAPETAQFACGYDDMVNIGVAIDWKTLYDIGMRYIAAMTVCNGTCDSNDGLEQFILTWFSIKLTLASCDFDKLGELWRRFLRLNSFSSTSLSAGCGCNRR